jgi:outer membrane murein-binding lipoprotein Lpp
MSGARVGKSTPADNFAEHSNNSPVTATAHGSGAQIVQVETLGRQGMTVMLVMFVIIVAIGIIAGYALGVGEARAENTATQVRQLNARVEVLQWELDKASAQLIEKGLITAPE